MATRNKKAAKAVQGTSTPAPSAAPAVLGNALTPEANPVLLLAAPQAPEAPATPTAPLTAFVAAQQAVNTQAAEATAQVAAEVTVPSTGAAVQVAAKAGFTRTVQNGRGDYTPHTIGALIFQTATALQALTPNTPITSAAVKLALPHIKATSISCGLSHWRKFNGTMRVKGQPRAVAAPATPVQAAPVLVLPGTLPAAPAQAPAIWLPGQP